VQASPTSIPRYDPAGSTAKECTVRYPALTAALVFAGLAMTANAAETEVHVDSPIGPLAGSLVQPAKGPAEAAVVILPGSGPTDRNGDNPMGVKGEPYRQLANALAEQGIASVRVDKRGMFGSRHEGFDPNHATIDAYADDTHAWASFLATATKQRCVWLLGHSEGVLVAEVAAQKPQGICGLILVSGAGRKAADILIEQLKANPANAPFLPQVLPVIEELRQGKRVEASKIPAPFQPLFNQDVQPYIINWFQKDPVALLKAYKGPVLVVQGDNDLQINMTDAHALAGARPGVELKVIPGMNHVLRHPAEGQAANIASYGDTSMPLASGLVDGIAGFIASAKP